MVEPKHLAVIGGALLGGYILYDYLKTKGMIHVAYASSPDRTQTVTTSGIQQSYRPKTSFYRGVGGSAREIENHGRGEAVTPKTWLGTYGSVPQQPAGTFNGVPTGLTIPEEIHVTPELEARLAQSSQQRTWAGGGTTPSVGTFG